MRQVRIQMKDGGHLGFLCVTAITTDGVTIRVVESFDWGTKVSSINRENVIMIHCDL